MLRVEYRVSVTARFAQLDGATVATPPAGRFPSPLVLRGRTGRRLVLEALAADGRVLATAVGQRRRAPSPRRRPCCGSPAPRAAGEALAALVKAAHPDIRIELVGGGTGMGIADAARGIVDAGLDEPLDLPRRPERARLHAVRGRATAAWSPTACPRQLPADGVATAAPEEFLEDLGTKRPRQFASSAEAAAYVRATAGAWGYVDPVDSEGLQVGLCRSYPLGIVTRGAPGGALAGLLRTIAAP